MAKLPSIHARDALKAFERLGWIHRRTTASHWIMSKNGQMRALSVPFHDPIAKGTLRSLNSRGRVDC